MPTDTNQLAVETGDGHTCLPGRREIWLARAAVCDGRYLYLFRYDGPARAAIGEGPVVGGPSPADGNGYSSFARDEDHCTDWSLEFGNWPPSAHAKVREAVRNLLAVADLMGLE
jgi:hypothetical protein